MGNKPCKLSGTFFNCISIDRNYNNQQSILPHMHDNRLELFYVCSGQGQYMVDNRYYPIGEGDIVICNQGVLHGEEPDQVRQIRSYSVAITDVNVEGLPPNCLIAEGECPVVSCGQLARQVGETMHLLYLLSADAGNLHAVCCSLAEAMLNLTDSLLRSRIHQQEQQAANDFMAKEFEAMKKEFPDCGLESPQQLNETEAGRRALQMWANAPGITLADAYAATHRREISKKQSAAAKQAAMNEMNSKGHLRQTKGSNAKGDVPAEIAAEYKKYFPNATHEEIAEMYRKNCESSEIYS